MAAAIPKIVDGKEISESDFRRLICDVLNAFPEGARAIDIVNRIGPHWDNPDGRHIIAMRLNTMRKSGIIRNVNGEKGLYQTTNKAARHRGGVSRFEQDEDAILDSIRDRGGMCRLKDICLDLKPEGLSLEEFRKTGDCSRINQVIAKSEKIRQDFNMRGWYNLPYEELEKMPLTAGVWIKLLRRVGLDTYEHWRRKDPDNPQNKRDKWWALRNAQIKHVGNIFKTLCAISFVDHDTLLDDHDVFNALSIYAQRAPTVIHDIRQREREEWQVDFPELNAITDYPGISLREVARIILQLFEEGSTSVHVNTPVVFFEAIASFFDIDAAQFSRGIIMPARGERTRPTIYVRPYEEIMDAQIAAEQAAAAQDEYMDEVREQLRQETEKNKRNLEAAYTSG